MLNTINLMRVCPRNASHTMEYEVQVYSKEFLETTDTSGFATASLSRDFWEHLYRNHSQSRFFLRIHDELIAVGNPVNDPFSPPDTYKVFVPNSFLERAGMPGDGETLHIDVFTEEGFVPATRIVLRSFDSAIYNSDVKAEVEQALTTLGVLKKHTQIQIPISALGNYMVDLFVSDLEPAEVVLCHGDEVVLEFEEPLDQIAPPRPPTPIPAPPQLLEPMITAADIPPPLIPPPPGGRTLGSDPNLCGPEWRRQIGPPRRRT